MYKKSLEIKVHTVNDVNNVLWYEKLSFDLTQFQSLHLDINLEHFVVSKM